MGHNYRVRSHHFDLRDDGEFKDYDVRRLWEPWQASRAAIEVELPVFAEFSASDSPGYVLSRCSDMLDHQGLKVKL